MLRRRSDCGIADLAERPDGSTVTVGGLITGLARKFTKKGDQMAVFVLEDLQDAVEVTVFPRTMTEQGHKLSEDGIVLVRGRVDRKDDQAKLMAQEISIVNAVELMAQRPLRLKLPASALDDRRVERLKTIVGDCPGDSPVILDLGDGVQIRLGQEFYVDRDKVIGELRVAFGHEAIDA